MRDIFEVIRQKENELERIQKELDALRLAARLLEDPKDMSARVPAAPIVTVREPATAATSPVLRSQTAAAASGQGSWSTVKQFP
jgi:hypothetical protein